MLDLAQLKTEITTDPAGLGYAPLVAITADQALADLLNAPRAPGWRPVDVRTLLRWGIKSGALADIVQASTDSTRPKAVRAIALGALKLLDRLDSLDPRDPDITAMVQALTTAGVLTTQQQTELLDLGRTQLSRAEQLFGPGTVVSALDVARALGRG